MGSPISHLVANLFMEEFKANAISIAPNPPRLWLRYVDDTFVIQQTEHSPQFLQHINSIDQHTQFTTGTPFLDTVVSPGPSNTLITSVYRKPIHKDQYIYWDSHHNLLAKYSIFNSLTHRARVVCINQIYIKKRITLEKLFLDAITAHGPYIDSTPVSSKGSVNQAQNNLHRHQTKNNSKKTCNISIVVPFSKGLSESFKKLCDKVGVKAHYKGGNTIRNVLVALKDKDKITQKSGGNL